jgi:hypothetical protein
MCCFLLLFRQKLDFDVMFATVDFYFQNVKKSTRFDFIAEVRISEIMTPPKVQFFAFKYSAR